MASLIHCAVKVLKLFVDLYNQKKHCLRHLQDRLMKGLLSFLVLKDKSQQLEMGRKNQPTPCKGLYGLLLT